MESRILICIHPTHLLTMKFLTLILITLNSICLANTPIDIKPGDLFPSTSQSLRFLPATPSQNNQTTSSDIMLISEPTMFFLPPTVKSIQVEPLTYKADELTNGIKFHYKISLVIYGIFYVLYFIAN